MPLIRTQVTLPYDSGVPEDASVATFWFEPAAYTPALQGSQIAGFVSNFFTGDIGLGNAVQDFLSPVLAATATTRQYLMTDPEPRAPEREDTFALVTAGTPIPSEVALCLSLRSAVLSGVPQGRRRGRLFIGPLNGGAVVVTGGVARPDPDLIATLVGAAERLRDDTDAANCPWQLFSREDNIARTIVGGYIDDEFDTMRSRGHKRTSRTNWS